MHGVPSPTAVGSIMLSVIVHGHMTLSLVLTACSSRWTTQFRGCGVCITCAWPLPAHVLAGVDMWGVVRELRSVHV
jgi:hypothetical protein